jgi:hypothetical protein
MAKDAADDLNRTRTAGETHYYRVYRLASNLLDLNGEQISQTR